MDSEAWRLSTLKTQSQELQDALANWQGANGIMRNTISAIKALPYGNDVITKILKH